MLPKATIIGLFVCVPNGHASTSLEQIAERAGFPNRHYFSRVFIHVTDESPAHFRAKHGGDFPVGA